MTAREATTSLEEGGYMRVLAGVGGEIYEMYLCELGMCVFEK